MDKFNHDLNNFFALIFHEISLSAKNWTLNIPNLRESNFEHIRTSHLGPKPNFEPLKHHQKLNSSQTSNCSFLDYILDSNQ